MRNLTGKPFWRTFVTGAVAAAAGNTAIYVAARAAGVGFVVTSADSSTTVPYAQVAIMSVIPVLVGAVVLRLANRRARLVEAIAVIITLLSLGAPLTMGSDTATAAALAVMHVVAGAVFTIAAETTRSHSFVVARRRERASNTASPAPSI